MKRRIPWIGTAVLAALVLTAVAAQADMGPRRMTLPVENLAKETYLVGKPGQFTFALAYEYEILEDALQGSETYPNLQNMFTSNNTFAFETIYGISKNISFSAIIPFRQIQNTSVADSMVLLGLSEQTPHFFNYERGSRGLGDIVLMSYFRTDFSSLLRFGDEYYPSSPDDYDNYYGDEGDTYAGKRQGPALALALGVRLPTGKNDQTDDFGTRLPDDLQLGAGTMDPIVGLLYFQRMFRFGWGLSTLFRMSSQENIYHYEWGKEFTGSAYLSYRLSRSLEWNNQVNLTLLGRDTYEGRAVANTGAKILMFAPSLIYDGPGGVSLQATAQIPLYRDFNEIQLTSDYIINLRTAFNLH